jgi:hypothetical protein
MVLLIASVVFDDFEFGNPFAVVLMLAMLVGGEIAVQSLLFQRITTDNCELLISWPLAGGMEIRRRLIVAGLKACTTYVPFAAA